MEHAIIQIYANQAAVTTLLPITAGTVGAQVVLHFDPAWDGYQKTLVWRGSGLTVDDTACTGRIPQEVLTQPHSQLLLGVYGVKEDKVLPTVWAELGEILPGADPSGDESADPSLPVWAQVRQEVADVRQDQEDVRQELADVRQDQTAFVKNTDYASNGKLGVVSIPGVYEGKYGIVRHPDQRTYPGGIAVQMADETDIEEGTQAYKPIVPANLPCAVKRGLGSLQAEYVNMEQAGYTKEEWDDVFLEEQTFDKGQYIGQVRWVYDNALERVEAYMYIGHHPSDHQEGVEPGYFVWTRIYPPGGTQ